MNLGSATADTLLGGEQPFFLVSNFLTSQDNATKIKGKHEFQFGFQFRFEDVPKSIVSAVGQLQLSTRWRRRYTTLRRRRRIRSLVRSRVTAWRTCISA